MNAPVDITAAAEALRRGHLVAFPTETVYGLGALATHADAVRRVFERKGRPADNPLIVHISAFEQLALVARHVPESARRLMDAFWPGPLTLLLDRAEGIPDVVTAGLPSVAVRWPDHPTALALINAAGPLVAPSANLSGRPSPTTADHVRADFGPSLFVLDGGPCRVGLESTVADARHGVLQVHRPGHLSARQLAAIAQLPLPPQTSLPAHEDRARRAEPTLSPGMKYRHYAPNAVVAWLEPAHRSGERLGEDTMALVLTRRDLRGEHLIDFQGDLHALAQSLYACFRRADALGCVRVLVERPCDAMSDEASAGIAEALLNRVNKAIAR